jgi:hypothetical protein
MTFYPFEMQIAVDANNPGTVVQDGSVTISLPDDATNAPLPLVDRLGVAMANPITTSRQGFIPAFQATVPLVRWSGGSYGGFLSSYQGLLDQATTSATAADSASTSAALSAIAAQAARLDAETAMIAAQSASGGGTGDVVRTRIPLNVKDYGAIGDGTTDDTAAIQAALDAVPDGGRAVYLPAGRYKVTSTLKITRDATYFYGDGTGNKIGATQTSIGSRLEPTAAVTGSVLRTQRTEDDRPLQGVVLRDFTIEGQLLGTGVTGILFRSNQGHMERVHIWRMSGVGLDVKGYPAPFAWDTYDSTFHNLQVSGCVGTGVLLDDDSADTHWSHSIFYDNQDNLIIKGASGQFTGCHFYGPVRHNIWFNGGGSRTKFANCKIEGLNNHMVNIDSTNGGYSDIQFTGCGFSSNKTSGIPDNTYDYVNISGPSANGISRTTFVGNSFTIKGGTTLKPRYAINLNGSAVQGTVIIANSFGPASHWGTLAINNSGSSSTVATIKANANVVDTSTGNAQPFINVADFGAVGNGTDSTAALQAALDSVPSTGATVWLPAGNYRITAPLVIANDNTTLRGAGAGSRVGSYNGMGTRISATAGAPFGGSAVIKIARPDATRAVYAPKIVDIAIDTQAVVDATSAAVDGLAVTALRGDFDNVSIWSASGHNLRVVGISASLTSTGNRFRSIVASQAAGNGILVDANAPDNTFAECVVESNNRGIQLVDKRTHLIGCDFNGNTLSNAYITDGGTSTRFTSCKFRFAINHGVELTTVASGISDVSFTGCNFEGNGSATTNTYDHLIAQGPTSFAVSRLAIVGCSFISSATNKPRYGVNLASSAVQNAMVVGNVFGSSTNFGTSAYNNASNSTLKNQVVGNTNVPDIQNSSTVTANYTLALADANTNVDVNLGTAITITVPTNATVALPIGTRIRVTQIGAGQVTIAGAGVTFNTARTLTTRAQYSVIELRKRSTDTWVVSGDLT